MISCSEHPGLFWTAIPQQAVLQSVSKTSIQSKNFFFFLMLSFVLNVLNANVIIKSYKQLDLIAVVEHFSSFLHFLHKCPNSI